MRRGYHHIPFTPELWGKWLKRFNAPPRQELSDGIEELRRLLNKPRRKRA